MPYVNLYLDDEVAYQLLEELEVEEYLSLLESKLLTDNDITAGGVVYLAEILEKIDTRSIGELIYMLSDDRAKEIKDFLSAYKKIKGGQELNTRIQRAIEDLSHYFNEYEEYAELDYEDWNKDDAEFILINMSYLLDKLRTYVDDTLDELME
ncbi:hypothetical protein CPIN18021_0278 [Campylobacter pinnipediorum subsp. caledonicus]|uniref:Uncharacterized protein n=1 Tax=Campylobacter pinnipediorum subsp. caledonicus TaxID=1874362 RepID=A0A1S6U623_9BACT|nr:hypothetical protein [Campylobacter pinnipediorum]AQW87125.1 hypothetical protein CPIN18021_0278 [Campylobacter pinnipediorum subsp. caledonicus]